MKLTNRTADRSPRGMTRLAGFLYLVITIAAIIAHFYVPSRLLVPGDAAATANNILASEPLFRIGIGSEFVILLSEIVLSIVLYVLLKPVSKTLSLVAAVFRLAMTIIHGINLLNSFFALLLLSGADYLAAFKVDQLHAFVLLFLNAHHYGFEIGIVFFAPHVFVLGYLIFMSASMSSSGTNARWQLPEENPCRRARDFVLQVLKLLGWIVVNYSENQIKTTLEETHASDCLHNIRITGCFSAQRRRKTDAQGQ
jgi:hypothetical protein